PDERQSVSPVAAAATGSPTAAAGASVRADKVPSPAVGSLFVTSTALSKGLLCQVLPGVPLPAPLRAGAASVLRSSPLAGSTTAGVALIDSLPWEACTR